MGDFADRRCGVGSSLAALVGDAGDVEVLDPAAIGAWRFAQRARQAARAGGICVAVYPTRSTVYRWSLPLRLLTLWWTFGRGRLRLHLHEFQHLRRMLRWPVAALLPLTHRVVVSSDSERRAVAAAWRGAVGRWCEVVVAPPTNGTAAPEGPALRPVSRSGTVGVFGMRRDDKPLPWLVGALGALDPSFRRLELAGGGWEGQPWPPSIRARFDVRALGHVDPEHLAAVFAGWDLALAPFSWPAHDGRMSLRTPLAYGVPTLTVGPPGPDLTLRPRHLALTPPSDPTAAALELLSVDAEAGAEEVAAFERHAAQRLLAALFAPRGAG
jgi:hypothetical protein